MCSEARSQKHSQFASHTDRQPADNPNPNPTSIFWPDFGAGPSARKSHIGLSGIYGVVGGWQRRDLNHFWRRVKVI